MLHLYILIIHTVIFWLATMIICKAIPRQQITIKNIITNFFVMVIFMPFIEESIFRSCLVTLLKEIRYCDIIISNLFGLLHITNTFLAQDYSVLNIKQKIILAFLHSSVIGNLGYYLTTISLGEAIIVHILYNFCGMLFTAITCYKITKQITNIVDIKPSKKNVMVTKYRINCDHDNDHIYYCDADTRKVDTTYDFINIEKKPEYIKAMHDVRFKLYDIKIEKIDTSSL